MFVKYVRNRQLIQLLRFASFKPAQHSMHAQQALNPFNIWPPFHSPKHSLSNRLPKPRKTAASLSLSLSVQTILPYSNNLATPNQPLSHGVYWQTKLYHRNLYTRVKEGSTVALTGCSFQRNNGKSGSKLRYRVRKFTPFDNCFSTFLIFEKFGLEFVGYGVGCGPILFWVGIG